MRLLYGLQSFSYPEPFLRAVNGARRGALAKSISNWHLIGYNKGYRSNTGYILLPCFYGIRFWIWPEPLVAPRVRRALGTRMGLQSRTQSNAYARARMALALGKLTTGTPKFRGSGFVGMHVKPITAQEKFNFPRANAILARAQALLWVRDCMACGGGSHTARILQ